MPHGSRTPTETAERYRAADRLGQQSRKGSEYQCSRLGDGRRIGVKSKDRLFIDITHSVYVRFDPRPPVALLDQRELLGRELADVIAIQLIGVLAEDQCEV
jgi:hypothetical protein